MWQELSNEELLADWEANSPRAEMEAAYLASVPRCTDCDKPLHRDADIAAGRCTRCRHRQETTT